MSIGAPELFFSLLLVIVPLVVGPFLLYWVIRLAVRHALRDVPAARAVASVPGALDHTARNAAAQSADDSE